MADDDTLSAAPAQADTAGEQAVPAVAEQTATEAPAQADTADAGDIELPERKWADKYKSPEVLEEAHLNLQRQFTFETQRRAELERQISKPVTATPATPVYTPEQLEGAKIDLLDKMADARVQGDATKAREYASQIVWCDRELMNQRVASTQTQSRAQSAEAGLMQEVAGVVQQYQGELVPGNALHDKAAHLLDSYLAMGMPNNAITQSHAIVMAAQLLGKTKASVEQDTRRNLTNKIQSTLKSGVIAGAGQASTGAPAAGPDFMNMPKADFEAWKRANVR